MRKFFRNGIPKGNRTYVEAETRRKSPDRSLTDRRWYENRRRVERILEREIVLAGDRNRRARAWLALFLGNPHELRLRSLLRALREDPGMVASRPGDLLGWLRRAVAWRIS